MSQKKALRRRCDRPACRKRYRYSDPRSRTCSESCRRSLNRAREKAAAQVEADQVEAERHEWAQARAARMKAQARTQPDMQATRASPPAPPARTPAPPPAPPAPDRYTYIGPLEPPPQVVTIRYRKPYTTPI